MNRKQILLFVIGLLAWFMVLIKFYQSLPNISEHILKLTAKYYSYMLLYLVFVLVLCGIVVYKVVVGVVK